LKDLERVAAWSGGDCRSRARNKREVTVLFLFSVVVKVLSMIVHPVAGGRGIKALVSGGGVGRGCKRPGGGEGSG